MGIPEEQWTPWVGKRLTDVWVKTLDLLKTQNQIPYRVLVYEMLGFGDLAPRTVANMVTRAIKREVFTHDKKSGLISLGINAPIDWLEPPKKKLDGRTKEAKKSSYSLVPYGEGGWYYLIVPTTKGYAGQIYTEDRKTLFEESKEEFEKPVQAADWAISLIDKVETGEYVQRDKKPQSDGE